MMKSLLTTCLVLCCLLRLPGQSEETAFLGEGARKMNAFATAAFKAGYPKRAREVWLELIAEYDKDDEVARKALGFLRVGASWAPDPEFLYPDQDRPDAAAAANLARRWNSLSEELGRGHMAISEKLSAAGANERAAYHRERAARFLPNDSRLQAARGATNFEGFVGTPLEIGLLRRSRQMAREVEAQLAKEYPVQPIAVTALVEPIVKAGYPLKGFASEHFQIFGDHPDEVLMEAARNAERALAFSEVAFEGADDAPKLAGVTRCHVFLTSKEKYATVLKTGLGGFPAERLEFIVEHTSSTNIGGTRGFHFSGVADAPLVQDLAVRNVAQGFIGARSDALREGVGHAIVGLMFGRTLIFAVDQERQQRTVAGRATRRLLVPDISSWSDLAVEHAWQRSGTVAAELPLLSAASFPDDARIKSWSFVDYLLRRDPSMIRKLDFAAPLAKNRQDVEKEFIAATGGVPIQEVDDGWRRFWTEDTPLLRAVRGRPTPLEAVSRSAGDWLSAFNDLRKKYQRKEVGWSESFSSACKVHVEYLKANGSERGIANEHTQKSDKRGASNTGRAFARWALVSTSSPDARRTVASWIDLPGYRDAILNPNIDTVGLFADGPLVAMDVSRGTIAAGQATMAQYPFQNQKEVPVSIAVKDLGPDVEWFLQRQGKGSLRTLGYPLSLHFYHGMPRDKAGIKAELSVGKDTVEGLLHFADSGTRRACAPGLVVFYPLQPLKKGQQYVLRWTVPGRQDIEIKFST